MNRLLGPLLFVVLLVLLRLGYSHLMSSVQSSAESYPIVWSTPVFPLRGTFTPLAYPTPSVPGHITGPIAFPR